MTHLFGTCTNSRNSGAGIRLSNASTEILVAGPATRAPSPRFSSFSSQRNAGIQHMQCLEEENEDIVQYLLDTHPEAELEALPSPPEGQAAMPYNPGLDGMEHVARFDAKTSESSGMFVARLRKKALVRQTVGGAATQ
eukprot:CAMPEP_0173073462 /NCGR_PEP_ID=MMETSP1102-20130122/10424_1 /TAXON_ID=49646 /ORGANISM="Geminigera sp., Strain Caron Lab Isolate" /LENGTH=137 /DNA_ID=CAMNT_0013942321 /DNA_START=28 /DNA_END=442 /DNA_ORIENTATION=+